MSKKKRKPQTWLPFRGIPCGFRLRAKLLLCCFFCSKALAAVNSLTFGGLEGNLAFLTALYANSREHLSCALLCVLFCGTAVLTSCRLVLKAVRCIEFLLTCCEHEIIATFFALQCLVLVHVFLFPRL